MIHRKGILGNILLTLLTFLSLFFRGELTERHAPFQRSHLGAARYKLAYTYIHYSHSYRTCNQYEININTTDSEKVTVNVSLWERELHFFYNYAVYSLYLFLGNLGKLRNQNVLLIVPGRVSMDVLTVII